MLAARLSILVRVCGEHLVLMSRPLAHVIETVTVLLIQTVAARMLRVQAIELSLLNRFKSGGLRKTAECGSSVVGGRSSRRLEGGWLLTTLHGLDVKGRHYDFLCVGDGFTVLEGQLI